MTDTSELVRRLRFWMPIGSKNLEADLAEAADRLEALEAQNKRLRGALEGLIPVTEEALGRLDGHDARLVGGEDELKAARAALKEGEG